MASTLQSILKTTILSLHTAQTLKKQLAINQPSGSDQPQRRSFKVCMRNPQSTQDIQQLNNFTIFGRIHMLPRSWENHHHQTLNAQTFWVCECVRWNKVSNQSWGRVRQVTETVHWCGQDYCSWWENCISAICCEDLRGALFARENACTRLWGDRDEEEKIVPGGIHPVGLWHKISNNWSILDLTKFGLKIGPNLKFGFYNE